MIFFLIIEKQGPPLFEKRNDFIWSNTRHRREFVELKIQKLFFRAFEFWLFSNFAKNFRDLNELEEIDKVEVKKEPVILNY